MNIPKNLKYVKSHEWVEFSNESTAKVGLSDYAQNALGALVYVSLPEVGDTATSGESIGEVESVKAVFSIYSPLTGVVTAINEDLLDNPKLINDDPYGSWMVEISEITANEELLDPAGYEEFCRSESESE